MKNRAKVLVLASLATFLVAVPSAGAAVTMGSDLSQAPDDGVFCATTCSWIQSPLPGRISAAPTDGVIVRWRIRTDVAGGPFALQVARPAGGGALTGIATSPEVSAPNGGVSEFPVRISVKQGDNIGIKWTSSNMARFHGGTGVIGAAALYFPPALADGDTRTPAITNGDLEFFVNADLEADVDGDGFGDETQDLCVGQTGASSGCAAATPTVSVKAATRQSYRKLNVTVTGDRAATVTAGARVVVKIGKRRKSFRAANVIAPLAANTAQVVKLAFKRATRGQLKKLLKARRKLTAAITVKVADVAGNTTTVERKVKLKL